MLKNFSRFLWVVFATLFFNSSSFAQTNLGNLGYYISSTRLQACQNAPSTATSGNGTVYTLSTSSCGSTTNQCYSSGYALCVLAKYYSDSGGFWGYHALGYVDSNTVNTLCDDGIGSDGRCYVNAAQAAACVEEFDAETGEHCVTGTPYDSLGNDVDGYDANNCMSNGLCEGDSGWEDRDGYDTNDCKSGLCPGDSGWEDAEGYDYDGFDSSGVDRGGNGLLQGGGYGGSAGTGGTPPSGYVPYESPDHQSGDNRDNRGSLRCETAYPITILKSLVPANVLDGLAGCANECSYQPTSTVWDFDLQQEVVTLFPNGDVCSGGQPNLDNLTIAQHTANDDPVEPDDTLNFCYIQNGYFICQSPLDAQPICYSVNSSGDRGGVVGCGSTISDPNTVCGTFNGLYMCLPPDLGCQSFYGVIQCIDSNGDYVSQNDPDHILNGGNGDGNSGNDVFADESDVIANGNTVQDQQLATLNARGIAQEIGQQLNPQLQEIADALNQTSNSIDGEATAEAATSFLADALQGVGEEGSGLSYSDGLFEGMGFVSDIFESGAGCQELVYDIWPEFGMSISLDTCSLELVRLIVEFFLYGSTLYTLYILAIRGHS